MFVSSPSSRHPHNASLLSPWLTLPLPVLAALASIALWLLLPPGQVMHVLREGGPVEGLTEKLYFILAAALWFSPRQKGEWRITLALTVLLVAAGAREMDLHKSLTGFSVLKVSFYLQDRPLSTKLIALCCVGPVAAAALYLLHTQGRALWQRLRLHEPVAGNLAIFFVTLVVTKVLDRSLNILAQDFSIPSSPSTEALVSAFEEVGELSLPMIAMVARWQYLQLRAGDPQAPAAGTTAQEG